MTNCKECKQPVSTSAKACPHCGVKDPAVTAKHKLIGLGILIGVVFALSQCASSDPSPEEEKAAAAKEAACKQDLQCWGDKQSVSAGVYCADPVEKLAKYSARWTDGTLEPKFSHFRWLNKEQGTLTVIGDKIEFQNGFGAYQAYTYECDYDPATKTVLDVRAQPGRI